MVYFSFVRGFARAPSSNTPHSFLAAAKRDTGVASTVDLPFLISYLDCNGEEERLLDCSYGDPSRYCYPYDTVGVDCVVASPDFEEGEVLLHHLQEEGNHVNGFLAIFTEGSWAAFCGELDHAFTQVACRNLGYYDKGNSATIFPNRCEAN